MVCIFKVIDLFHKSKIISHFQSRRKKQIIELRPNRQYLLFSFSSLRKKKSQFLSISLFFNISNIRFVGNVNMLKTESRLSNLIQIVKFNVLDSLFNIKRFEKLLHSMSNDEVSSLLPLIQSASLNNKTTNTDSTEFSQFISVERAICYQNKMGLDTTSITCVQNNIDMSQGIETQSRYAAISSRLFYPICQEAIYSPASCSASETPTGKKIQLNINEFEINVYFTGQLIASSGSACLAKTGHRQRFGVGHRQKLPGHQTRTQINPMLL